MATGHLNPGYDGVVTKFRRAKSAHPGSLHHGYRLRNMQNMNMDSMSLEEIRQRAREIWSQPDRSQTTYGDEFHNKVAEVDAPTQSLPTEAARKNKPHPPL